MNRHDIVGSWKEYELIDSGANRKLERFGKEIIVRPETQALWSPARPAEWKKASAEFRWSGEKGSWQKRGGSDEWKLSWHDAHFTVRLTSFKHIGVFPEQAANWEWIRERASAKPGMNVLNLFGYTGIASIVAAQAGAKVIHVDASKQSNTWSKDNAALSKVPEGSIRYILDDAMAFVLREGRRGNQYDGIILDPPAFGRGPEGEVWRIEEHLPQLLTALKKIFSPQKGSFFVLNGYAAGYSPLSFLQATQSAFGKEIDKAEFGELAVQENNSERCIPSGIYLRFVRS